MKQRLRPLPPRRICPAEERFLLAVLLAIRLCLYAEDAA
jgi:hypothetical protein